MRDTVDRQRRALWIKHLHRWHWISSAVSLVVLLMFSVTGFTLNHAAGIEAAPRIEKHDARLPDDLLRHLASPGTKSAPVAAPVAVFVATRTGADIAGRPGDWSDDEVYVSLPRPGGDGWVSIDRETGKVETERSSRGVIAYLNDLHKGRHAGPAWGWFIDIFALACVIFSVTGLLLLKMHAAQRGATWPLVAFGLVLPLLLALIFIH